MYLSSEFWSALGSSKNIIILVWSWGFIFCRFANVSIIHLTLSTFSVVSFWNVNSHIWNHTVSKLRFLRWGMVWIAFISCIFHFKILMALICLIEKMTLQNCLWDKWNPPKRIWMSFSAVDQIIDKIVSNFFDSFELFPDPNHQIFLLPLPKLFWRILLTNFGQSETSCNHRCSYITSFLIFPINSACLRWVYSWPNSPIEHSCRYSEPDLSILEFPPTLETAVRLIIRSWSHNCISWSAV